MIFLLSLPHFIDKNKVVELYSWKSDIFLFLKEKEQVREGSEPWSCMRGCGENHAKGLFARTSFRAWAGVGREALWNMAKDLGRQFNVKEVIIQGGKRTTGKYKGQIPSPIQIKVD